MLVYSARGSRPRRARFLSATWPFRGWPFTWRSVAVATSKSRATVTVWDVATGTRSHAFQPSAAYRRLPSPQRGPARCCLLCERRETARGPSGRVRAEFAHADGVRAVALSGAGTTLVTSCRDHKIHVWDVTSAKSVTACPARKSRAWCRCIPMAKRSWRFSRRRVVIDVATGKPRFQLDQGPGPVSISPLFR